MTNYLPRVFLGYEAFSAVEKEGRVSHVSGRLTLDGKEQVILVPNLPTDTCMRESERDLQLSVARYNISQGNPEVAKAVYTRLGFNGKDRVRERIELALADVASLARTLAGLLEGTEAHIVKGEYGGVRAEIVSAELRGGTLMLLLEPAGTDVSWEVPLDDVALKGETAWALPRITTQA